MAAAVENIRKMLQTVNLYSTAEHVEKLFDDSTKKALSYEKFLEQLLKTEIQCREHKRFEKRLKQASFAQYKTLDEFNIKEQQSLSQRQLNQLKELTWIGQGYNLILLGPPGVGKTH